MALRRYRKVGSFRRTESGCAKRGAARPDEKGALGRGAEASAQRAPASVQATRRAQKRPRSTVKPRSAGRARLAGRDPADASGTPSQRAGEDSETPDRRSPNPISGKRELGSADTAPRTQAPPALSLHEAGSWSAAPNRGLPCTPHSLRALCARRGSHQPRPSRIEPGSADAGPA